MTIINKCVVSVPGSLPFVFPFLSPKNTFWLIRNYSFPFLKSDSLLLTHAHIFPVMTIINKCVVSVPGALPFVFPFLSPKNTFWLIRNYSQLFSPFPLFSDSPLVTDTHTHTDTHNHIPSVDNRFMLRFSSCFPPLSFSFPKKMHCQRMD